MRVFIFYLALTWALNLSLLQGADLSITLRYDAFNKKHTMKLQKLSNRYQAQHAFSFLSKLPQNIIHV